MLSEFEIIDAIVAGLGDRAAGEWITLGPGDDAAVITASPGLSQVASIDTLLPDVHFPSCASPAYWLPLADGVFFGFGSHGRGSAILLGLIVHGQSQAARDSAWVETLAQGMAAAAKELGVYVCGGNCRAVR